MLGEISATGKDPWTDEVAARARRLGLDDAEMGQLFNHVEMKASVMMIRSGATSARVIINHAPCGSEPGDEYGCHAYLPDFIPAGSTLTVLGADRNGIPSVAITKEGRASLMHEILEKAFLHVEDLPPDLNLVAEIKALNVRGVEIPWIWSIATGPKGPKASGRKTLGFGIFNDVGVLEWSERGSRFVPASGKNDEWIVYYMAGMHDTLVPPRAEVPAQVALEALAEFLGTRARPTCVEWTESAELGTPQGQAD